MGTFLRRLPQHLQLLGMWDYASISDGWTSLVAVVTKWPHCAGSSQVGWFRSQAPWPAWVLVHLPSSFRKHTSESLTGDFANMFYAVWFDRTPQVINVCVNSIHCSQRGLLSQDIVTVSGVSFVVLKKKKKNFVRSNLCRYKFCSSICYSCRTDGTFSISYLRENSFSRD